jgi:osmoprotectant transport system permease protein
MMLASTKYTTDDPVSQGFQWLADAANWQGPAGIPSRILEHLGYAGLTLAISLAIAIPIGLYVGHTGAAGLSWWPWPGCCGRFRPSAS